MWKIPLSPNSKKPLPGEDWHLLASENPADHETWVREGKNVGCELERNGLVVVDSDEKEPARDFFRKHRDLIRTIVETRRGAHFYFRGTTKTRKLPKLDIKGNGYCVFPPSIVDGWQYRFVPGFEWTDDLTIFPEHLFPQKQETTALIEPEADNLRKITRAQAYAATVICTAGQKAHNTLFRLCCWMRNLGLSQSEAYAILLPWNQTHCFDSDGTPYPFSTRELTHKLEDSYRRTT